MNYCGKTILGAASEIRFWAYGDATERILKYEAEKMYHEFLGVLASEKGKEQFVKDFIYLTSHYPVKSDSVLTKATLVIDVERGYNPSGIKWDMEGE